jgi:hypothetical protein
MRITGVRYTSQTTTPTTPTTFKSVPSSVVLSSRLKVSIMTKEYIYIEGIDDYAFVKANVILVNPIQVYIECPHCGKIHMHGAALQGIDDTDFGPRVPHCSTNKEQYVMLTTPKTIREAKTDTKAERKLQKIMRSQYRGLV